MDIIGQSPYRKDAWEKVTGMAKYTGDLIPSDSLFVELLISPYAHAQILSIDVSKAKRIPGVRAILTGKDAYELSKVKLTGEKIKDRPILAYDRVRYNGEPIALVVADYPNQAKQAIHEIIVTYEPIKVVHSPSDALEAHAPLIHPQLGHYIEEKGVYPEPGTNISHRSKIRKGNMAEGWSDCAYEEDVYISFQPSDHAAMETRSTSAEILSDNRVIITSSSQAPYTIKKQLSYTFGMEQGKIRVHTPLVGGAFGGKSAIQLEFIVVLASLAVGGKKVSLINSREQDMITSPVHIGLEAWVKLGCDDNGFLKAGDFLFLFDSGAYSDKAIDMAQSAAMDCTGPYNIENVHCDSLSVYTNHPYATSFRGFSHSEFTFALERCMDQLAQKLSMDPLKFRHQNALRYGDTSPTQEVITVNTMGNIRGCMDRLKQLIDAERDSYTVQVGPHLVRSWGVSCFWKNSTIAGRIGSGAILTFNEDGTVNLSCGVVEIGQGSRSVLAQIASQALQFPYNRIYVQLEVDTSLEPEHWKTVASRGLWLAGRAVVEASEDAIRQLKETASQVLMKPIKDLSAQNGTIFVKSNPKKRLSYQELAHGYVYPNGVTVGGQVIGRGQYSLPDTTYLDKETGKGKPGPDWTVGAQAVEVELNTRDYTYKLVNAITVIDAGTIINPTLATGQVKGAMDMGLSFASREGFVFDKLGRVINNQFRTYKLTRFGENPNYHVEFLETPSLETAYGLRGVGEHGIIGMPAALANSLSHAVGVPLNHLPLTPELIWRKKTGETP